jgi:hypothetical protein
MLQFTQMFFNFSFTSNIKKNRQEICSFDVGKYKLIFIAISYNSFALDRKSLNEEDE